MKKIIYPKNQIYMKLIPIIISAVSLIISFISIAISSKANDIAITAKNINKDSLGIQLDQISQTYVSNAYDDVYYNSENSFVMQLLKRDLYVRDTQILTRVIDIFEGIGNGACQGTIKFRHIRPYLGNSLLYICSNRQLADEYEGKRNGVAILCHELHPKSDFAKSINMTNISTCEFWDSNSFPNTSNRDRFQIK